MASSLPVPQAPAGQAPGMPDQKLPEQELLDRDLLDRDRPVQEVQAVDLRDLDAQEGALRATQLPELDLAEADARDAEPEVAASHAAAAEDAVLPACAMQGRALQPLDPQNRSWQDDGLRDVEGRGGDAFALYEAQGDVRSWAEGGEGGADVAGLADLDGELDRNLDEDLEDFGFEAQTSEDGGRVWIAGDGDGDGLLGMELGAAKAQIQLRDYLEALHARTCFAGLPGRRIALAFLHVLGGKTPGPRTRKPVAKEDLTPEALLQDIGGLASLLRGFVDVAGPRHRSLKDRAARLLRALEAELPKIREEAGQDRLGKQAKRKASSLSSADASTWLAEEAPAAPQASPAFQPHRPARAPRVFNLDLETDAGEDERFPASAPPADKLPAPTAKGVEPATRQDLASVMSSTMISTMASTMDWEMGRDMGGARTQRPASQGSFADARVACADAVDLGPLAPDGSDGGNAGSKFESSLAGNLSGDAGDDPLVLLKERLQRLSDTRMLCGMPGRRTAARLLRLLGGSPLSNAASSKAGWLTLSAGIQEETIASLCEALQRATDAVSRGGLQMPGIRQARALLGLLLDAMPAVKQRVKQMQVASQAMVPASLRRPAQPAGMQDADACRQAPDLRALDLERLCAIGFGPETEGRREALLACAIGVLARAFPPEETAGPAGKPGNSGQSSHPSPPSQQGGLPLACVQAAQAARAARLLLDTALSAGMGSGHARRCWRLVQEAPAWFLKEAQALARLRFAAEAEALCLAKGEAAAAKRLKDSRMFFGEVLEGIAWPEPGQRPAEPLPGPAQHTLWTREPQPEWDIYIDESGDQFSREGADASSEGRVVAVCLRKGTRLPDLGLFHSCDRGLQAVLGKFRVLLASGCGLIGFTRAALGASGPDGWLVCICDLVKWVWRLLPLLPNGEKTVLHFHVEERMAFAPGLGTDLGRIMLEADLRSENPRRALQMRIASISFESKQAPMLAWADIAAYLWGRADAGACPGFGELGLAGSCLVACDPSAVRACEAMLRQGSPSGRDWTSLMQEPCKPSSIQALALEWLRRRCLTRPSLWEPYRQTLQEAVEAGDPDMDMLERMAEWLRPMSMPTFAAEFFWHAAQLRRLPLASPASRAACLAGSWNLTLRDSMAAVEGMLKEMVRMQPKAVLHGALRLAEADCALFRFAEAACRLKAWNPEAGGRLPGTPWEDALVLCHLGRCLALQREQARAERLFREAQGRLARLAREKGAGGLAPESIAPEGLAKVQALARRVRRWRALALLDDAGAEPARLAEAMERALGMPVAEASRHWGAQPLAGEAEAHLVLVRFLAEAGSEADRRSYRRLAWQWARPRLGMAQGMLWVRIQYYRWLLTGESEWALRHELVKSLVHALPAERSPGDELVACAVLQSLEPAAPASAAEASLLEQAWRRLSACLPGAAQLVRRLQDAIPGDPWLARKSLPFDLC